MTAQLTHETRLTSIALSTTSFPIIWCAGHLPAQNNDCHMFYQKLLLCINDGPVIVTGMNSIGTHFLFMGWDQYPLPHSLSFGVLGTCQLKTTMVICFNQKLLLCINNGPVIETGMNSVGTHFLYQWRAFYCDGHEQRRHPFPFHGMRSRLLLSNNAWLLRWKIPL